MTVLANELRGILELSPMPLYQTHTIGGEELNCGYRGVERRALIDPADIKGKRVLDLGCASGAECFWALEHGATEALGIDVYHAYVALCMQLREAYDSEQRRPFFRQFDLARGVPAGLGQFDTVFCFAVTHHLSYRAIWREVDGASVAYVEGGGDCPFTAQSISDDNWTATLIGKTPGSRQYPSLCRPLFRLARR